MKKTKLMHTLLALTLSCGTFSSQAMPIKFPYPEYDYATYVWSIRSFGEGALDANGKPKGYMPIFLDDTRLAENPTQAFKDVVPNPEAEGLKYYVDNEGNMLVHDVNKNTWEQFTSTNTDAVNRKYKIGAYATEETTPEETTPEDSKSLL